MALWVFLASWAAQAAEVDLSWNLSLDGELAGEHTLTVREVGEGVRILESYTVLRAPGRRAAPANWTKVLPWNWGVFRPRREPVPVYQHRLTASDTWRSHAFHSVTRTEGSTVEVQGRPVAGVWRLSVTNGGSTRPVVAPDVTFTTMDLLDPESPWRGTGGGSGQMLDVRTSALEQGSLVRVGEATVALASGTVPAEQWEWRGSAGTWRLFYAPGGALVRYEATLAGRSVRADLVGHVPVFTDDFDVPLAPAIEAIEISP